jgi:hypothetical protein
MKPRTWLKKPTRTASAFPPTYHRILDIAPFIVYVVEMDGTWMTREQLDSLADQIANLSLRIDVAQHSLFTDLRQFDAHDGWHGMGFISTATWLAWRIGIGPAAAREHVRVARALGDLHLIDAAFAAGQLSYSKVRALTRIATPTTEEELLSIAMHATASQIEKLAAAYRRTRVDPTQPNLDLRRFMRRADTSSGMVRIELQLPPEQANIVWEAMNAALDSGRREDKDVSAETPRPAETSASVLQTERADAIVNVAQAYLQSTSISANPARSSMSAAHDEPFPPRSAAHSGCATAAAGPQAAAASTTCTPTTSKPGPTAARHRPPTWSYCAQPITRSCTRAYSP